MMVCSFTPSLMGIIISSFWKSSIAAAREKDSIDNKDTTVADHIEQYNTRRVGGEEMGLYEDTNQTTNTTRGRGEKD